MILAHKIQLDPNNKQRTYFAKACGTARFAYNWALAKAKEQYEKDKTSKFKEGELRKELNAIKREQFPWMLEVTKCAPQLAIKEGLARAFRNFFSGRAEFPKFHKKGEKDSFSLSNDQFAINNKLIRIPNLGHVRMTEALRFCGKVISATISRKADKWYVSVQIEMPDPEPIHKTHNENQAVGVDLGVKDLAVLSDGIKIVGAKPHKALLSRLRRINKSLSRKQGSKKGEKKSNNFNKAKKKLARLHARITNIRNDELHKLTTSITKNYSVIGIEDLNVSGMVKNHKLARAINDVSFFEFRRQLEYKAQITGGKIVVSNQFFPSSKLCSTCGYKNDGLTLKVREWNCPECGSNHDRDINAAINLKNNAVSYMVSACGELVETVTSMKQELNFKIR
jgi:putative transposase